MQQHNLLQTFNDVNHLRVELQNEASVLKLGEMVLQWNQVEMASISLRKNSSSFNLVFASRDNSCFDFLEVSLAITPAAASLVQKIHENVEVTSIPRALLVLPLRKLYSGAPFWQVYWWYQVVSNMLEIMFALTFFVTLQRRFQAGWRFCATHFHFLSMWGASSSFRWLCHFKFCCYCWTFTLIF